MTTPTCAGSSNKMENWSTSRTLDFITEVEGQRCLWDVNSPDYKNKLMRTNAYNMVAEKCEVSSPEVSRKFKNLRTQFSQEIKRMQKPGPSGSGFCKQTKWAYFEPLKFLEGSVTKRQSLNTTVTADDGAEIPDPPTPTLTLTPTTTTVAATTPTAKRKKGPISEMLKKAHEILNSENDECQIFADYIAMELRKFDDYHRTELKRRVLCNFLEVQELQRKKTELGSSRLCEHLTIEPDQELLAMLSDN